MSSEVALALDADRLGAVDAVDAVDTVARRHTAACLPWVDLGLEVTRPGQPAELYASVLIVAEALHHEGCIDRWFFLHKPPGLRWRMRCSPAHDREQVAAAAVDGLRRHGVATAARVLVYEPQFALFGGSTMMEAVHESWQVDSATWARWHADERGRRPRLEVSFQVLARMLLTTGVVGWQDREVWRIVSQATGRRVSERQRSSDDVRAAAGQIVDSWEASWYAAQAAAVPPTSSCGPDGYDGVLLLEGLTTALAEPWHGYPEVTPRAFAAYWLVFHWNRAGFTGAFQSLVADTLTHRPTH